MLRGTAHRDELLGANSCAFEGVRSGHVANFPLPLVE